MDIVHPARHPARALLKSGPTGPKLSLTGSNGVLTEGLIAMSQGRTRTMLYFFAGCLALIGLGTLTVTDAGAAQADDRPVVVLDTTAGPITIELDRAQAPIYRRQLPEVRRLGLLRRPGLPPRHPRLHDPGRRHDRSVAGEADPGTDPERGQQRPEQPARDARDGPDERPRTRPPPSSSSTWSTTLVRSIPTSRSAGYAVFGKVIGGMEVVDAIANVPTGRKGPHEDVPLEADLHQECPPEAQGLKS